MSIDDSERRFRALFESAAVGIMVGDLSTMRVVEANPAAQRIFGYTEEELIAKGVPGITHPDDYLVDLEHFQALAAGQISSYQLEKRYLHKSGEIIWGRLVVTLARDAEGRPRWVVAMLEDVTERKRAEEALRLAEDRLRQAQTLEAIGRLAGGVAHDFNNMLTVILSYSTALIAESPSESARRELEEIERAALRAAELVRQLMAYSRQELQRPHVIALGKLVGELEPAIRQLAGERIQARFQPGGRGRVLADPSQLERVILNLVLNARDAMPERGTLSIETSDVMIDEATARARGAHPGAHVMLAVGDTGCGMDELAKARIFEPYFTTKERGKGTGLGLATVYGIVQQSGGHIVVDSQVGRGTTLRVFLPHTDEEAPPHADRGAIARRGGAQTILLVEDEAQVRAVIAKILVAEGFDVIVAEDPQAALARLEAHRGEIDLLLTDVMMAGFDGPALAARLRATRPSLPVLFMSGYGGDPALIRTLLGPHTGFVQKPLTPEALILAVGEVLA